MQKLLVLLSIVIVSSSVHAAVDVGENLIFNGSFENASGYAEQGAFPEFWSPSSPKCLRYLRAGGPEGKRAAIVLSEGDDGPVSIFVRQQGLTLVEGGIYKLSVYIKTSGFKTPFGGVIVHNSGWANNAGLMKLPVDSGWTLHEKTITMFASQNNNYSIALFAKNMSGEIAIADVKLEAISAEALQGSSALLPHKTAPSLIPITPLLNKIPLANPKLIFQFYGHLPHAQDAYECLVTVSGNHIPQQTVPLQSGKIHVNLASLPCGNHTLEAILQHRKTHAAVLRVTYPISIVDFPEIDHSAIKPLNSLVSELLNQSLNTSAGEQTFTFDTPRDGWIFMALVASSPAASGLKVTLDGQDTVITSTTDRLEAFRAVAMGTHSIKVSNGNPDMRLHVRSIPEIFNYPPCVNSYVKENGRYNWAFMKSHILYAVTTLNGGNLPGNALPEAKARGLRWLANCNVAPVDKPADIRARMESHPGMIQPQYDGFTSDEISFERAAATLNYTQALRELRNPENRLIYTWVGGTPSIPSLHTDFISTCLNISSGHGCLLFEVYCRPQVDKKAAEAYLDNMIIEPLRFANAFFPNAAAGSGIILGNFNQIPILSLEHNPDQDYKYFLDMQVNLVANHPDFKDLATVGYWGTYYGDEELVRWSFKLMRHYAVEGRTEMLSEQYGFTFASGFLKNGDFVDGLNGWSLMPATNGSIRAETLDGYGKKSQGRYGLWGRVPSRHAGDTVCVMTRQPASTNRISQTARGLKVGRAYCLQFVTADHTDVTEKKHNPRRYGIDFEIDGVERISGKSFVHIDRRAKGVTHTKSDDIGKINLHRIVFRAKSSEQSITFNDAKALPGEALCINFIQLNPYFE